MDTYPEDVQPDPLYECTGCTEVYEGVEVITVSDTPYCPFGHQIVGKVNPFD